MLPWRVAGPARASLERNLTQQPEIAQHSAGAQNYVGQRVISDGYRQPGFFANPLIQILEQRAPSRQHDAPVADIGGELGWGALERYTNRVQDSRDALGKRFPDFAIVDRDGLRHAFDQVAAFNFHGERL